jgi:hypothetical protein
MDLQRRGSLTRAVLYDVKADGQGGGLKDAVLDANGKVRVGATGLVVRAGSAVGEARPAWQRPTPCGVADVDYLNSGRLTARQAGEQLWKRVKTGWEWAAVLAQVEIYGWTRLNMRCCART